MESMITRLHELSEKLICNTKIGSGELFDASFKCLFDEWNSICVSTKSSLEELWKCHYSWMEEQLKAANICINNSVSMIDEEIEYINFYPFETITEYCGVNDLSKKCTRLMQYHEVLLTGKTSLTLSSSYLL